MFRYFLSFLSLFVPAVLCAEPFNIAGGSYRAMREIDVPNTKAPVVVTPFLHQGLVNLTAKNADPRTENAGKSVLVTNRAKKPVPFRILQLGPGDYCRIAIQNDGKANGFTVYYGVPADKQPNEVNVPEWTNESGLLFEARAVAGPFGMDNLDEVRAAFEKSKNPIGADYVETVFHGYNPLTLRNEPFLSKYTGTLNVVQPGKYAVVTSSHHCSFLLIDGKVAAEQPGRRDRSWEARPEIVKHIELSAGKHKFEYYHAAADENCSMLAVWQFNPDSDPKKLKLSLFPKEAFGYENIQRVYAGAVKFSDLPGSPDFVYHITGSVPLPDNDAQMIAVQFQNKTAGLAASGKLTWHFGDGQTSTDASPLHIYLKPGLYAVELKSETVSQKMSAVNRIDMAPPRAAQDPKNLPTLDQYLSVIEKYDAAKFDAETMLQLVDLYQAKIDTLNVKPETKPEWTKYRRLIAESVRNALVNNPNFKGDNAVYKLALSAGRIARDYLLDEKLAEQIYAAAAAKLTFGDYRAECYAMAADTALDTLDKDTAGKYLESGQKELSKIGTRQSIKTFYRVKADYLATLGKGEESRTAISQAEKSGGNNEPYSERVALQGSASRSAESFLAAKDYDRMIESIRTWQLEYPAAAYDGFITLLTAKYWLGRGKFPQAGALADRQLVLNPDSPYIDELLLTAAEAMEKAGNKETARAYLNSLIKDYPGSPLVNK
ncbi:MAG: hypothetical protein LBN39_00665, partial [Planctomycetaceae bacterium]|nr:hypothetical protein [Planctomycetaceae bacterium]